MDAFADALILTDENDLMIGTASKREVHVQGLRHRAFSIFIENSTGELLLQRRALAKYHSGGLWANACCGHPLLNESVEHAARRRLREELGLTCGLTWVGRTSYRACLDNGMQENEIVHLFRGWSESVGSPDPSEIMAVRWVRPKQLRHEIAQAPDQFAYWFQHYFRYCWSVVCPEKRA
jgi:isopentenyl-diphosphate delta-isomerase